MVFAALAFTNLQPKKDNDKNDKGNKSQEHGGDKGKSGDDKGKNIDKSSGNNLGDFANRKHPKDQKKVTICHNPSSENSNNGVTINVSENALQAHLNHGDQRGNCNINYSDRWSDRYVKSRENVYNISGR